MPRKPNYDFDRRRKEQERKTKKENKRAERQQRRDERRSEEAPPEIPCSASFAFVATLTFWIASTEGT